MSISFLESLIIQCAAKCLVFFYKIELNIYLLQKTALLWFFTKKNHNYATAQRIFNRFCQNHIIISWHNHLRIFTESFVKFVQKLWEIYGKNKYITFFWTRCTYILVQTEAFETINSCASLAVSSRELCVTHLVARVAVHDGNVDHDDLEVLVAKRLWPWADDDLRARQRTQHVTTGYHWVKLAASLLQQQFF